MGNKLIIHNLENVYHYYRESERDRENKIYAFEVISF